MNDIRTIALIAGVLLLLELGWGLLRPRSP